MEPKNDDIYSVLKFNHFILKCIGLVHFSLDGIEFGNKYKSVRCSIGSDVLHAAFAILLGIRLIFYNSLSGNYTLISRLIQIFSETSVALLIIITVLWSRFHRKELFLLFKKITTIDEILKKNNIKPNYQNNRNISNLFLGIEIAFVVFASSMQIFLSLNIEVHPFFLCLGLVLLIAINILSMSSTCLFLIIFNSATLMFDALRDCLQNQKLGGQQICVCAHIYSKLYDFIKFGCHEVAAQTLFTFTSSFVIITFDIYGSIIRLYNSKEQELFIPIGIGHMLYKIFVLCIIVQRMQNSIWYLKTALLRLPVVNKKLIHRDEVNAFYLQILHNDIKISVCGLFNLSCGFGLNIVASMFTYLVILLQTDPQGSKIVHQALFHSYNCSL